MDSDKIKQVFRVKGQDFDSEELAKKHLIDTSNEVKILRLYKERHYLGRDEDISQKDLCKDIINNVDEWHELIVDIGLSYKE